MPLDREHVAAYQLEEADRCPRCGTSPWEWVDDPTAKQVRPDRHPWESDLWLCYGCEELDHANEELRNTKHGTHGRQARLFKTEL